MKANQLGENRAAVADVLSIGFSSNDAVGHVYGPDSPEIADEQIRLDRTLDRLIEMVSARLGSDNMLWVLSADHGAELRKRNAASDSVAPQIALPPY